MFAKRPTLFCSCYKIEINATADITEATGHDYCFKTGNAFHHKSVLNDFRLYSFPLPNRRRIFDPITDRQNTFLHSTVT